MNWACSGPCGDCSTWSRLVDQGLKGPRLVAGTSTKGSVHETFVASAVAMSKTTSGETDMGNRLMSPMVLSSAQASRACCPGMSPVSMTTGRVAFQAPKPLVSTPGRFQTAVPNPTRGCGSSSRSAANLAACSGSTPRTEVISSRAEPRARVEQSATRIHAPRGDAT